MLDRQTLWLLAQGLRGGAARRKSAFFLTACLGRRRQQTRPHVADVVNFMRKVTSAWFMAGSPSNSRRVSDAAVLRFCRAVLNDQEAGATFLAQFRKAGPHRIWTGQGPKPCPWHMGRSCPCTLEGHVGVASAWDVRNTLQRIIPFGTCKVGNPILAMSSTLLAGERAGLWLAGLSAHQSR